MERFTRLIVAGGIVMIAGLWVAALLEAWSAAWAAGTVLALLGAGAIAAGINSEIELGP